MSSGLLGSSYNTGRRLVPNCLVRMNRLGSEKGNIKNRSNNHNYVCKEGGFVSEKGKKIKGKFHEFYLIFCGSNIFFTYGMSEEKIK